MRINVTSFLHNILNMYHIIAQVKRDYIFWIAEANFPHIIVNSVSLTQMSIYILPWKKLKADTYR